MADEWTKHRLGAVGNGRRINWPCVSILPTANGSLFDCETKEAITRERELFNQIAWLKTLQVQWRLGW